MYRYIYTLIHTYIYDICYIPYIYIYSIYSCIFSYTFKIINTFTVTEYVEI